MSIDTDSLLQQFIPEARDLLEQASRSLLALERDRTAAEPMNALFRAVHTLKGTSGLFDILPLTRAVHAGEDVLAAIQSGEVALAPALTDSLLNMLDHVGTWIDSLATTSMLPPTAGPVSDDLAARLRAFLATRLTPGSATHGGRQGLVLPPAWLAALPAGRLAECTPHADPGAPPCHAITYTPDPDCFYRGEDPLALMRQIDGLLLLHVEPAEPWPGLATLDPFRCTLRLHALARITRAELDHLLRYVEGQVEVSELPSDWGAAAPPAAAEHPLQARILAAQHMLVLADGKPAGRPGRVRAAARALRGCLVASGREDLLDALAAATQATLAGETATPLLHFIAQCQPPAAAAPSAEPPDASPAETRPNAPATLRVEPARVDALMNLIGELVVAKNTLAYLANRAEQGNLTLRDLARELKDRHGVLNRIAEDMQGAVMAVRMLPVDHIFQRFPRLVRDIARRLDKQVELVIEGGETEADKNIIEVLADPLIHMLRNSLDHGIEPPTERVAAGKPAHGTLHLSARHDNDCVVIRLTDDGRGIDPATVRRKAVEKGLIDSERAATLSDEEAQSLIFAPGFSTAATVSDLSGRGVGMDVVRSAVDRAGGQVALSSRKGGGTTVEVSLPLSMAVSRIMTIACGPRLFGVPMGMVVETVRIPRGAIHRMRDREAFVLRDSVVPLRRLSHLLDLPEDGTRPEQEAVLVVRLRGERMGLVVDAFREGMEVIVKPMEGILAGLRGFSGTTLLGDGRVLLILDLAELLG